VTLLQSVAPAAPDEVVAQGEALTPAEVDALVERAQRAQAGWARLDAPARAAALTALAQAIEDRADQLGRLIAWEVGKPIGEARAEVARAAAIVRYHAQGALDPSGTVYPPTGGAWSLLERRRPRGVAGLITPWNFPLAIPLWKAAPALAVGNAVILKPATAALGCARALEELFAEHLPADVALLAPGEAETAITLIDHPGVGCISFTGSTRVGRSIIARAAARGVAVQAEMGGQNPSIVLADADVDHAAATIADAAMGYAGQKCTATSRIIVEARIADTFIERLRTAVERLPVGDPLDPQVRVGPVISDQARDRALQVVERSKQQHGGEVLIGGCATDPGYAMAPTLVALASPEDELARDEVFAPVAAVVRAESVDEAIEIANSVHYGLSAAVFTDSLATAARVADRLQAGMVRVNTSTAGVDLHAPFGGVKDSSYGPREQGKVAREFFTVGQTVTIALP